LVLMANMNEFIGYSGELYDFCQENDIIDSVSLLNPGLMEDPAYLYGSKRIDYICVTPTLAESPLKARHHQFHQYFITNHKGVYLQFHAGDLFDTSTMDQSCASY